MSNLSQQQSTICFLVDQCCEDNPSYNDYSPQIIMFIKQNQSKEVRPIVDSIKKIIKNKKNDSSNKVLALKLFNDCLTQGMNEEFLLYSEKKILRRLSILAKFKKESNELERGAQLFGKPYNQKASADFLKLLLIFIQKWSEVLPIYQSNGRQTEISKLCQSLMRERVHFPTEEQVYSSLSFDYSNPQSNDASKFNQSVIQDKSYNKNQFQSEQIRPKSSMNLVGSSSQSNLHHPPNSMSNQRPQAQMSQQYNHTSSNQSLSGPQDKPQQQLSSREQQMEIAKKIKEDYKKLSEYQDCAKLAEEIFTASGDSGANLDEEFLLQFRGQLTEGKAFTEKFLKVIMDESLIIKDKESKINKILGICNDISNTLEKILIFKPYSPRTLKALEAKAKEETRKEEEKRKQKPLRKQSEQAPVQDKQGDDSIMDSQMRKSYNRNSERLTFDVSKSHQQVNLKPLQNPVGDPFQQAQFDFKQENSSNIFKTNFAFPSNNNFSANQNDIWGTNAQAAFQNNTFAEFNSFQPIKSNFDQPQSANRQIPVSQRVQSPELKKKSVYDEPVVQKVEIIKEVKPIVEAKQVQQQFDNEIQSEEVKVQKIVRKPLQQNKTSAIPNLQLPSQQKPLFIGQVQSKPSQKSETVEMINPAAFPSNTSQDQRDNDQNTDENQESNSPTPSDKMRSSILKKNIDVQFGRIQKPKQQIPQVINDSPDADLSGEDEGTQIKDAQTEFRFPSPSATQKIYNNNHYDFDWGFDQSKPQSRQNQAQGSFDNFGFNVQPTQSQQEQIKFPPDNPFEFGSPSQSVQQKPIQIQSQNVIVQRSSADSQNFNFGQQSSWNNFQQNESFQKENVENFGQSPERFDFNMDADNDNAIDSQQISQLNDQIKHLRQQVADLKLKNDQLTQKIESNPKLQDYEQRLQQQDLKLKSLEKDKIELKAKVEETENQMKYYKKFEYLYEQEQFHKAELQNQIADLDLKLDEYRKMADRQEHQVNKKEKELTVLRCEVSDLTKLCEQLKEQQEKDVEDIRMSEKEVKKQLQHEIIESRKREEEARLQVQREIQEAKKREEQLKKHHQIELKQIKDQEEMWKGKVQDVQKDALKKEQEMKDQIEKLQQELKVQKEKQETPKQKIIVRPSQIKFNKQKSDDMQGQQLADTLIADGYQTQPRNSVTLDFEFQPQMNHSSSQKSSINQDHVQNKDINESPQIFNPKQHSQSPQQQHIDQIRDDNIQVNQFELGVTKQDDSIILKQVQSDKSDSQNQNEIIFEDENEKEDSEPETMPHIPSSDSDRDSSYEQDKTQSQVVVEDHKDNKHHISTINEQSDDDEEQKSFKDLQEVSLIQEETSLRVEKIEMINNKHPPPVQQQQQIVNDFDWDFLNVNNVNSSANQTKDQEKQLDIKLIENNENQKIKVDDNFWDFLDQKPQIKETPQNIKQEEDQEPKIEEVKYEPKYEPIEIVQNQTQIDLGKQNSQLLDLIISEKSKPQQTEIATVNQTSDPTKQKSVQQIDPFFELFSNISQTNTTNIQISPAQESQRSSITEKQVHQSMPLIQNIQKEQNNIIQTDAQIQGSPPKQLNGSLKGIDIQVNQYSMPQIGTNVSQNLSPQNNALISEPIKIDKQNNIPFQNQSPSLLPSKLQNQYEMNKILPNVGASAELNKFNQQQFQTSPLPFNTAAPSQIPNSLHSSPPQTTNINNQNYQSALKTNTSPLQTQHNQIDVSLDKSQFSTMNTEQLHQDQKQQQLRLNPMELIRMSMLSFFRKSLLNNKAVIYDDQNIQIGIMSDFSTNAVAKIRLFFGNKSSAIVSQIKFINSIQPIGFQLQQNKNTIVQILQDTQGFIFKWNFECGTKTEFKQFFNIDLNQCRSLTQLKQTLQLSKNTFEFVDGVELQKNIICGGTSFQQTGQNGAPIGVLNIALIKIMITGNGQNCEITARSSDGEGSGESIGKFGKLVISNILEMIAIKINQ